MLVGSWVVQTAFACAIFWFIVQLFLEFLVGATWAIDELEYEFVFARIVIGLTNKRFESEKNIMSLLLLD